MPTQKLHQNRTVVLGRTYRDAHHHLTHPAFRDSLDPLTLFAADSMVLTLEGSIAGLHVATVYVTPTAHRGPNYGVAYDLLEREVVRSGGRFAQLNDDGSVGQYEHPEDID